MFRTTEDPPSGRLVQCLVKNYKNDSIASVDMDKVGVMAAYSDQLCLCLAHCICCHNTDLVHVNGHDRTILVIFSQALYMLKDRRGYCQLKEEVLDRTLWRNRFGRDFGPVV